MIVGMLVLFFVFDWRLGLVCLVPVIISILCMFYMMGGRGMEFMTKYQDALVRMNQTGTEYVRGIPVVKVFQQTVYSFKAFMMPFRILVIWRESMPLLGVVYLSRCL